MQVQTLTWQTRNEFHVMGCFVRNGAERLARPVFACLHINVACMLAVTNPDTVKRIRSTLRRVALRPTRNVAGACFAARVRAACFALAVIGE